jgi:predicted MPP superfamily phosphohydrolase
MEWLFRTDMALSAPASHGNPADAGQGHVLIRRRWTRRRFLQWMGALAAGSGATAAYTRLLEPRWLDVERVTLQVPGLPERLAGTTLAQISDIHLSEYFSPERLLQTVQLVNRLAPRWVMLTGDYVGRDPEAARGLVEPLRRLAVPAFAVLGNHDLWTQPSLIQRYLDETSVSLLRNEAVELAPGLWLAGLDDVWSGRPDLARALARVPSGAVTFLMVHEPDFFDQVVRREAPVAVQFSGHSHGGQVRLPRLRRDGLGLELYAPILPRYGRRYPMGLQRVGERQVYTSRGVGVWPLPYRFNCRPEVSLFTLQPA